MLKLMNWPRRLAVRTSGSHPEDRGFESRRGHHCNNRGNSYKKCSFNTRKSYCKMI